MLMDRLRLELTLPAPRSRPTAVPSELIILSPARRPFVDDRFDKSPRIVAKLARHLVVVGLFDGHGLQAIFVSRSRRAPG